MSDDVWDIAVVGGGAAGLATAIFAAQGATRPRRIVILDGAQRLGAKILVAGGGRCNVTHELVTAKDFAGPGRVVAHVLKAFDEQRAVAWFASMGVELKRESTGKLFPVTDSARTVLDALLRRCDELGVVIRTGCRVKDVAFDEREARFAVTHAQGQWHVRHVVLATGGRSLPKTGSDGGAYAIARRLGHTVTDTHPALAPLVLADGFMHTRLSGVSLEVTLSTSVGGKVIDKRTGSLLWTHFGVSGPVVMDASRHWIIAAAQDQSPQLVCNLLPGCEFTDVDRWLIDTAKDHARRGVASVLSVSLPQRVADAVCSHVGVLTGTPMGQLSREKRRALVHALVSLPLPVVRDRGWNFAEVTAGGVPMREVDHRTMQSRVQPGLYLVGEILDVDGRIGGFNFQWAWSTGHIAGTSLSRTADGRDAATL